MLQNLSNNAAEIDLIVSNDESCYNAVENGDYYYAINRALQLSRSWGHTIRLHPEERKQLIGYWMNQE